MTQQTLGRLSRVDLREVWASEATEFTPWLAQPENLSVLAETLGIDLELEAQEKAVGPFRADMLCKDIGSASWVLVENQLERTDHNHLGQLLTYASGLQAVTIVWIAARFTEEHRSTLDWLNRITDHSFHFFGLEVELWKIEDSPAAPKFNIISKPNDWSRSVVQAARVLDDAVLTDTRVLQLNYWEAFKAVLDASAEQDLVSRMPEPKPWMECPIGRTGFNLATVMQRPHNKIRAELFIRGADAGAFFGLLEQQKEAIERELGFALEWEELPGRKGCRIASYTPRTELARIFC